MNRTLLTLLALSVFTAAPAFAADAPKLKGTVKKEAPKIDLGLPTFGALPTGEGMKKPKAEPELQQTKETQSQTPYTLVRVVNGKAFMRGPQGAQPSTPFPAVNASGDPLMMEKFSSVVRVKCPTKKSAPIEVAVLDPRGDTIMEASGVLRFTGGDEAEWTVDWESTGIRRGGDFQVLVRVAGQPLGTAPLKVAEAAPAEKK